MLRKRRGAAMAVAIVVLTGFYNVTQLEGGFMFSMAFNDGASLLLIAFCIKAAVFPLSAWLPDSYPTAPAPVTAVFAGLLTKVGVYALMRIFTLLFQSAPPALFALLLALSAATMP